MRRRRAIPVGAIAVALAVVGWALASLRDDDSSVSVLIRSAKERMCWPADSSMSCVLKAMSEDEKKGRFDDAIKTGAAWTNRYPDSLISGVIYTDISSLYLRKPKMDRFARQFKPDLAKRKEWEELSEWIDAAIKRVSNKSLSSGCQDNNPSLAG